MPAILASAPGKIILFGEHAVVYGRPAIAVPVSQVKAKASVMAEPRALTSSIAIHAPDIDLDAMLADLPAENPLALAVRGTLHALGIDRSPAFSLRISSTIPLAAGLGSGAAVSVAVIRAVSVFLGHPLPDSTVSDLAYEVEMLHHGTPSGIDNTVIAYARPVYFTRGLPVEIFQAPVPFTVVIGDTGVTSPTARAVGDVRQAWLADPSHHEQLFDLIGRIAQAARQAIEGGHPDLLGPLMDENQAMLCKLDVSSPELDCLVAAARLAGALGAKLSGAGRGGNMIALAAPQQAQAVAAGLRAAGATRTIITSIGYPHA
jgi:mevalonate kinase